MRIIVKPKARANGNLGIYFPSSGGRIISHVKTIFVSGILQTKIANWRTEV